MQINEIVDDTLVEGPIVDLVGNAQGALARSARKQRAETTANRLWIGLQTWIPTKAAGRDPKYVQDFLQKSGFSDSQITAASKVWQATYKIPSKAIKDSFGAVDRKQNPELTTKQIQSFLLVLTTENPTVTPVSSDNKRKKTLSKHVDTFDSDLELIIDASQKFGLKNPKEFVKSIRGMTLPEIKQAGGLEALAIIGYTTLRY